MYYFCPKILSSNFMIGSIIGGAVGALGGVLGSASKNKAIRQQLAELAKMQRENQNWYNRRYNEDATQRADAQRLIRMTEDSIAKRNKAAAGTAAVMGTTNEAAAVEKEAGNKALADVVSQINAANENRKDAIEQQYRQRKQNLDSMAMQLNGQRQNTLDMISAGIGGAANGASLGGNFDLTKMYIDKM